MFSRLTSYPDNHTVDKDGRLVVKVDLVDLKEPHIDMLDMTEKLDR